MMIATVVIGILAAVLILGGIFLIIGIVLKIKKKKVASGIFLTLAAINIAGVILLVVYVFNQPKEISTYHGQAKVKRSWIRTYEKALEAHDLDKLDRLIKRHPDMLYYYDINHIMLLDYGLFNCDIEMMELAVKHGAKFDEPLMYDRLNFYCSLDAFFEELDYPSWSKPESERTPEGQTTDKMLEALSYAIEHGAKLKWETNTEDETESFFKLASRWARSDGKMSKNDRKLLELANG